MSTQEQRERFEAWAGNPPVEFEDRHKDLDSFWCWQAWKADEAAAIERCAKEADMVRSKFSSSGHIQQAAGAWCVHEELSALLPKEGS